jgi:hypothetical protein
MGGDLFYLLGFGVAAIAGLGCGVWRGFGEVGGGDGEAVEEHAGAAGIDVVGGDALQDHADGGLDGGTVVGIGQGELEGGVTASALLWVGGGAAGGVVVVAEVLAAEADAAAAVAVGEDVAAEVALGLVLVVLGVDDFVLHGSPSLILCKVFKGKDLGPDFRIRSFAVNGEGPALAGPVFRFLKTFLSFFLYFYFTKWRITHGHFCWVG